MYIGSASLVVAIASQLDTDTFAFYLTTERRGVKTRYFRFVYIFIRKTIVFFFRRHDGRLRENESQRSRGPDTRGQGVRRVRRVPVLVRLRSVTAETGRPLAPDRGVHDPHFAEADGRVADVVLRRGRAAVHRARPPAAGRPAVGARAPGGRPAARHRPLRRPDILHRVLRGVRHLRDDEPEGARPRPQNRGRRRPAAGRVVPLQPVRRRAGAVVARHVPGIFRRYAAARPRRRVARVRRAGREQADRRVLSGPRAGLVRCPENRGGRVLRAVRRGHARRGGGRHGALPVLFPGHRRPVARHRGGLLAGAGRRLAGVRRVLRRVAQTEAVRHDAHAVHRRRVQRHATVTDRHS